MSRISKLVRILNKLISERPDEARRGIDRVGRAADRATGGRYRSKIERGTRTASQYVERRGHRGRNRRW